MIKDLPNTLFKALRELNHLSITNNQIRGIGASNVKSLQTVKFIQADKESICCIAHNVQQCKATTNDLFTNCEDLLGSLILRYSVWIISIGSFTANVIVIIHRLVMQKHFTTQNIIIGNLALADINTSFYLIILSSVDVKHRGAFAAVTHSWRRSTLCKCMAILSAVSGNMSLYVIMILTFYRCICIIQNSRLERKKVISLLLFGWVLAILVSTIPILNIPPFFGEFIQSDACILYNIVSHAHSGWEYGVVFFNITNLIIISITILSYGSIIYFVILKHQNMKTFDKKLSYRKLHISMIASILVLTGTNIMTWLPIIALSLMALTGIQIPSIASR